LQLYPLRMPFWTAPPEGVFVRKMKFGICIGQRVGVLRGSGRWEDFGRRVKGECISEYRRPRAKKLVFKVPSRIPGTRRHYSTFGQRCTKCKSVSGEA
jgi:hypothetical protein